MKDHTNEQFKCFLDLLMQVHINVPFVEACSQMLKYVRFLKNVVPNKWKFEEVSTITMSEESSVI